MLPKHNLLKPADGNPITLPNKEMAVGIFYITSMDESSRKEELDSFMNINEAFLARSLGKLGLREPINVVVNGKTVETTVGRLMLNERLPENFGFLNEPIKASGIKKIITTAIKTIDANSVESLIDNIKRLGFYGSTVSGISVSVFDNEMIEGKDEMIEEANKKVAGVQQDFLDGLITIEERKRLSNEIWLETTDHIADLTWDNLKQGSVIRTIIDSEGARAGKEQLKQLSAMRGLILDPLGKIVELPVKSNFREGLSIFEYVASARGSRKGLTDSALKTANAGYLTRRLVDVSHDVIIGKEDCGTTEGILVTAEDPGRTAAFKDRILGRFTAEKVVSPKTKKEIVKPNTEMTEDVVKEILDAGVQEVVIKSPITCKLEYGLCANCYGWDLSTKRRVELGVPAGVIAAQSIGEPGTQLTMRVRHFGGVVMSDVTQGLPRVEELFEMRTPKSLSPIAEISGKLSIETTDEGYLIKVKAQKSKMAEEKEYFVPLSSTLTVEDGQDVLAGAQLAQGYLDPKEVIKIKGLVEAQSYITTEAQRVYESQGIGINDKHFEVILRKMSDKVIIETVGDTSLIPGDFISKTRFEEINAEVLSQGGEPATARQTILGITKSSLFSDSWLSASSFQETTKVLTKAALEGSEDKLIGLKENVIIGRLIPVEGKVPDTV